jgi:hypothetical protein
MTVLLVLLLCLAVALAAKTCPSCGTENPDNARFCKKCGTRLPEAPARPTLPKLTGTVTVSEGRVTIKSDPTEADAAIDGRPAGKTPLELAELAPGRHQLTLTKAGYRDFQTTFTVTGLYGAFLVTSDPVGAEIILDGVSRGRTTEGGLTLPRLAYGRHAIAARLAGYRDVDKELDLKSPGPIPVNFKLGWGKGFLMAESRPSGASVAAGEQLLGQTPLFIELEPARYTLTLRRPGYHDWVGYTQVQYAETVPVLALLDRIKTRKLPLLLAGAVAGVGAGFAAYRGEAEYRNYQAATTEEESERLKASVQTWDWTRNAGAAAALLSVTLYLTLKW